MNKQTSTQKNEPDSEYLDHQEEISLAYYIALTETHSSFGNSDYPLLSRLIGKNVIEVEVSDETFTCFLFYEKDGQVPSLTGEENIEGESDEDMNDSFDKLTRSGSYAGGGWATFITAMTEKRYIKECYQTKEEFVEYMYTNAEEQLKELLENNEQDKLVDIAAYHRVTFDEETILEDLKRIYQEFLEKQICEIAKKQFLKMCEDHDYKEEIEIAFPDFNLETGEGWERVIGSVIDELLKNDLEDLNRKEIQFLTENIIDSWYHQKKNQ